MGWADNHSTNLHNPGKKSLLKLASGSKYTPTIKEAGVAGFELSGWYGVVAPSQTPQSVVQVLSEIIKKILSREDVQSMLAKHGEQAFTTKPEILDNSSSWNKKISRNYSNCQSG